MLKCKIRKTVDEFRTVRYYNSKDQLHRNNDLPAIEYSNGTKFYYKNGRRHRDNDLPAIEYASGHKEYYKNGKLHRDNDLPAIEYAAIGYKEYWVNGFKVR